MGQSERKRITDAGGKIENTTGVDRVSGIMNITRAIGDCRPDLKPYLIPTPGVIQLAIPTPGFMVLACDGLWDAGKQRGTQITNEEVGQIAATLLADGATNAEVAQALVVEAQRRGIRDNISVTVVNFNQPEEQPATAIPTRPKALPAAEDQSEAPSAALPSGRPGSAGSPEEDMPSAAVIVEQKSSIPVPPPMPPKSSASDQPRGQSTLPSDKGKELKRATSAMQGKRKSQPSSAMDIEKLMAQRRALLNEDSGVPIDKASGAPVGEASETPAGAASSTVLDQRVISSETPVVPAPTRMPMQSRNLLEQIREGMSLKKVEVQAKPVAPSFATSLQTGQAPSMIEQVQAREDQQKSQDKGSPADWE